MGWTWLILCICIGSYATVVQAGSTKEPANLIVLDPVTGLQSKGTIIDTDADGCWDQITGQSANGAGYAHHVIDGMCNKGIPKECTARVVSGSIETTEYVIEVLDSRSNRAVGMLIKDADADHVAYIPGVWVHGTPEQPSTIGIQMSVDGDLAVIAVPNLTEASVSLVQSNGTTMPLFAGALAEGNTTIALPTNISTGAYTLSVTTDLGSQSVSFTLQR